MTLEIIIPTKDRPAELSDLFASILIQNHMPDRILAIDAGTVHADYPMYKEYFRTKNCSLEIILSAPGLTYQRNIGIRHALGDIILFLDDDTYMDPDYCKQIMRIFSDDKDKRIGGVMGKITNSNYKPGLIARLFRSMFYLPLPGNGKILPSGLGNSLRNDINKEMGIEWLSGCNMAYRSEVFLYNLFDENFSSYCYAEDLDFSVRVRKQWELFYNPQALVEHRVAKTNRLTLNQRYKMLMRNHAYIFKKNFSRDQNSWHAFYISQFGILLQALLFEKSFSGFIGALNGFLDVTLFNNHQMPNFLERLDFKKPSKKQIAEHRFRYNVISGYCTGKEVLDCASGEGIGVAILSKTVKTVTGVDIDNDTIFRASKNIIATNVSFIEGSALHLPFQDNSFDVITSVETLEHLPTTFHRAMLTEFRRVLRPGGKIILTTPNKDRTSPGKIAASNYFHIGEVNFDELKQLMEDYFSNIEIHGVFNFTREGTLESIIENQQNIKEVGIFFRSKGWMKKIKLLFPDSIRNLISLALRRKSVYPQVSEFSLNKEFAKYASGLICIGNKQ
jgi:ubiquinone/menaquinone biosynthesis C-methylase UbiE/GT2 family glycosyltransferase